MQIIYTLVEGEREHWSYLNKKMDFEYITLCQTAIWCTVGLSVIVCLFVRL